jgi:exonuclease SbcC
VRPHRLELQGFTAYRDRQAIDFTSLDLFVITGPTGAGKTSLLDAMSLALYGRVPRMGGQGLGQLVSHGQAEARVLLEFGVSGSVYRVARRLPRNGAQSATFERLDGERWVDITERGGVRAVNEAVIDCVVLDFESFCKAIVLPQGDFARFLKGDPPERRKTLVALLGLGAYERMGSLARERASELRIRAQQTRNILDDQFGDATATALEAAEADVTAATDVAQRAVDVLAQARTADTARASAETRATTTARLVERFATLSDELTSEVETCRQAEVNLRDAEERRQQAAVQATAASVTTGTAESTHRDLVQSGGTAEELSRAADALERRDGQDRRVADAEREVGTARAVYGERCRTLELSELHATAHGATAADARKAEVAARVASEERRAGHERAVRRHAEAVSAEAALAAARSRAVTLEANEAVATAALSEARATQVRLEQSLEVSRQQHLVVTLVAGVEVGDPCPVCARPLAEHPEVDPDVAERLALEEAGFKTAREEAESAQRASAAALAALQAAQARISELEGAPDDKDIETLAARVTETEKAAELATQALGAAAGERERADAVSQSSVAALERARAEVEGAEQMLATRQDNLTRAIDDRVTTLTILRGRFGDTVPDNAAEQIAVARAALQLASEHLDLARRAAIGAQEALRKAEHVEQATQAELVAIDVRLGELRIRAEIAREDSADAGLASLPIVVRARDTRASELAEWCRASAATLDALGAGQQAEAERATNELLTIAADAGLIADDVRVAMEQLVEYERSVAEARVRAKTVAAELARRVGQRTEMEAAITDSRRRTSVLEVLARDLRADHFIDFVVQETLDLLAVRSSAELLRISDDRYSLVSSDGSFSVIDHVNADEQRSVKTLSGGESFMASLSLALALSKHVSELAGEGLGAHLEAVFIDEGFGSLDPETLDEVIDALERLREDELLVGVISHIPALAERIRVGLEIRSDGGHSQVVQTS